MYSADYLIIGGGPAGCAAAITLLQHQPGAKVILAEAGNYSFVKPGEALHSSAMLLLEQLGIWKAFKDQDFISSQGFRSYWGNAEGSEEHIIFSPNGNGWHLNRARFDEFMAHNAEMAGVHLLKNTRFTGGLIRTNGFWKVRLQQADKKSITVIAKKIIDATGRKATIARRCGANLKISDGLCAVQMHFTVKEIHQSDHFVQVEAARYGWWYSALLPDHKMAVAFFTDAEYIQQFRLRETSDFITLLKQSAHTWDRIKMATPGADPHVFSATSQCLVPACGEGWAAAGDAACTFDPLSGQGMVKALRTGIYAAYTLLQQNKEQAVAIKKYNAIIKDMYEKYLNQHILYYSDETRWREEPFWLNRAGKLLISPDTKLSPGENKIGMSCKWLNEEELKLLKECVSSFSITAEGAIREFRKKNTGVLGDRRVLMGLQWLIENDFVKKEENQVIPSL